MTPYEKLIGPAGHNILQQLYNGQELQIPDCPEAADAVDDFLNTDRISPVLDTGASSWDISAQWQETTQGSLSVMLLQQGSNHHVVVKGTRSQAAAAQHHLTRNHYFVVANIQGMIYVIDAMVNVISNDLHAYCHQNHFNRLDFSTSYEATESMAF